MISTGEDGYYEIEVPPGEYTLVAYPSGQYQLGTAREIHLDGDREIDLKLPVAVDLRRLSGRLLDEQGNEIAGALVQFYGEQTERSGQVQTEEDGYYSIDLPAGRYRATAGLYAGVGFGNSRDLGEVNLDDDGHRNLLLHPLETAITEASGPQPQTFSLRQNYPNPFNATTVIAYQLERNGEIDLAIYNLAGQQVAILIQGHRRAGAYTINWNGRDRSGNRLATGVYLYRLEAGDQVETRKLLLLR